MGKTLKIIIAGIFTIIVFTNCTQERDVNPAPSYTRTDVIGLWIFNELRPIINYRIIMDIHENSTYGLYADTATGDTVFVHEGTWSLPNDSVINFQGSNCQKDTSDSGLVAFPCGDAPVPVTINIIDTVGGTLNGTYWPVLVGDMETIAAGIGIDVSNYQGVTLYMKKTQ